MCLVIHSVHYSRIIHSCKLFNPLTSFKNQIKHVSSKCTWFMTSDVPNFVEFSNHIFSNSRRSLHVNIKEQQHNTPQEYIPKAVLGGNCQKYKCHTPLHYLSGFNLQQLNLNLPFWAPT